MARVVLTANFALYTGGESELELEAESIRQLLRRLGRRFPDLAPHLEAFLARQFGIEEELAALVD